MSNKKPRALTNTNKEYIGLLPFIDCKEFELTVGDFFKGKKQYYTDKILTDKDLGFDDYKKFKEILDILEDFENQFMYMAQQYNNSIDLTLAQKEIIHNKIINLFK